LIKNIIKNDNIIEIFEKEFDIKSKYNAIYSENIDYYKFLRQKRGEKKKNIVLQDFDKNGVINLIEVKALYNAKHNKDVLSERKTGDDVYGEFI
jgi:hypothetical protein